MLVTYQKFVIDMAVVIVAARSDMTAQYAYTFFFDHVHDGWTKCCGV